MKSSIGLQVAFSDAFNPRSPGSQYHIFLLNRFDWEDQLLYKAIETNLLMKQYMEELQKGLQTMAGKSISASWS